MQLVLWHSLPVNHIQRLLDIGLVRVRLLGPVGKVDPGSVWWVGQDRAAELLRDGEAEAVPLTAEELKSLGG